MSIADELITRGWHSGSWGGLDGSVCLMNAAHRAATAAGTKTIDALQAVSHACGGSILKFNDTPGRTFDEVLRVAKEADEILDAQ